MPKVLKLSGGLSKKPSSDDAASSSPEKKEKLVLPGRNVPPNKITAYSLFLHGEKGIGKTTLAACYPDPLIFMFEPGRKNLPIVQVPESGDPPLTWRWFQQYVKLLVKDGPKKTGIQTVVTDTIDRAYEADLIETCWEMGIKHPNDVKDYGATWSKIKRDFEDTMNGLAFAGYTTVFVSHSRVREVQPATGEPYDLLIPTCSNAAWDYVKATCDLAFYYGYHNRERWLTLRGNNYVWAACNMVDRFRDPKGNLLEAIPMGSVPEDGYKNLCDAFDNKLYGRTFN